jgi:xylulokinase
MEGITHLLKINIDHIEKAGYSVERIISTGGGAKSDLWSQLKANITGFEIAIPLNEEAASLGSAMIGAVSDGVFESYEKAIEKCVSIKKKFKPKEIEVYEKKHALFLKLYESLISVFRQELKT